MNKKNKKVINQVIDALQNNQKILESDKKLSQEDMKIILADMNFMILTLMLKFKEIGMFGDEDPDEIPDLYS